MKSTAGKYRVSPQFAFNFDELIVDSFAGGGGASTGIEAALGRPVDIAINHDAGAIAMHMINHPQTRHICNDVHEIPPRWATQGQPVGLLWASPDCTHHSKAKGGKPIRDGGKRRGLAWVVEKWAREIQPRVIILENVEEFRKWGPLGPDGLPVKSEAGNTFRAFVRRIRRLGYAVEHRELRACDYGAPTIRKRLFLVARCDGLPIVWPEPTHGPGLKPYRTAADIIDWSIPCPSIFERKRPLVENTMRRIARGIQKFVIENPEPFIVTYYGPKKGEKFRGQSIKEPLRTQTTENRFALVAPVITEHANGSSPRSMPADEPLRTVCAYPKGGSFALVAPVIDRQFGRSEGNSADNPLGTITAGGSGKSALVTAFLAQHNTGATGHEAKKPLSTITSRGTQQAVVTSHLLKLRGTCKHGQVVTDPMPTITAGGTHVGEVRAFLLKYYGTDQDPQLREPLHTVTTRDRFGLVTVHGQPYQIVDIGMRMLSPRELFRAQGFPENYIIDRDAAGNPITKTEQVARCGNSVCPPIAEALVRANVVEQRSAVAV